MNDGSVWTPSTLSSDFKKLAERAGVAPVRFHDLRHTHATQLLRAGIHPKVVRERLGHSTVAITLDVYSHVTPAMQSEAAERVDSALRAAFQAV
jgi:integrase